MKIEDLNYTIFNIYLESDKENEFKIIIPDLNADIRAGDMNRSNTNLEKIYEGIYHTKNLGILERE